MAFVRIKGLKPALRGDVSAVADLAGNSWNLNFLRAVCVEADSLFRRGHDTAHLGAFFKIKECGAARRVALGRALRQGRALPFELRAAT